MIEQFVLYVVLLETRGNVLASAVFHSVPDGHGSICSVHLLLKTKVKGVEAKKKS